MSDLADRLNAALAGRYAIQRELGRGGMATVFLAEDLKHRRRVAIKVLHAELAALLGPGRFLREIEIAAGLTHPHILPLHDSGEADGLLFYVMPYAEGESLRHRLGREKQLPVEDALRITRESADALDYAHRRGVIHRDIKPENILLLEQHAVVADFGIARAIAVAGGERLTTAGTVIGTPAYMSPEQVTGSAELDGRCDQYSLACVLYEMLAGEPPFTGPTAEALAHQHLSVAPRPVTQLRTKVPAAVEHALERALAKAAADRFPAAAEFGGAIATPAAPEAARGAHPQASVAAGATPRRSPRVPRWLALGGAIAAVALIGVVAWLRSRPEPPPAEKQRILVADFDGPPDDSSLGVTARDLVSAAIDQSRYIATVPRDQIRLGLESAQKPVNTRLDAQLARELAYRSSVRTVLTGTIGRAGGAYSVVLRVEDAESPKILLTERATARNEDALVSALGSLAERIRAGLGERRSEIQASRMQDLGATPSFEAYRLYVRGRSLGRSLRYEEAILAMRDALELDPDFAMAWRSLGVFFSNTGQQDSSLAAFDQALMRPQRLTTVERLTIEANRATTAGDFEAAMRAFGRALQHDPSNSLILQNRSVVHERMGHFTEALEDLKDSYRADRFGRYDLNKRNESRFLSALGRADEARSVAREIQSPAESHSALMAVEMAAANWTAAESLAVIRLSEPDPPPWAASWLASAQAARGALNIAGSTFERAENNAATESGSWAMDQEPRRSRLMLSVVSAGLTPPPTVPWGHNSSAATLLTRGLQAASAGDGPEAYAFLQAVRARPQLEQARQGATPDLLAARIKALAGRWSDVAQILEPVARQRVEVGYVTDPAGMSVIRWFLADAFEQLGQPDSAASCLERITSDPAPFLLDGARGIVVPFAHRRLVLLYASMGRLEDARRHWEIFSQTMRTPDPELQPLISEARDALRSAEAMARSTRR